MSLGKLFAPIPNDRASPWSLHRKLKNIFAVTGHCCSLHGFLVCLLAPHVIMLKASSTLCAFLALASRNLMFRESASSFVSPVDTTFFDGSSHLFPTRSLLTPRRLINLECCLCV